MDIWLVTLVLGELALCVAVVGIVLLARHRQARLRSEERFRLLERFESAEELARFMETTNGGRFLDHFAAREPDPRRKIVFIVGLGIVLEAVGMAFLVLAWLRVFDDPESFLIPGVLCSIGGGGVLLAGWTAARLTRTWSLADAAEGRRLDESY